ncbi:MAG: hypothetical protein CBB71_22800 [Rhodopirellula sp. TMED11]|nr:MAG: hypothetical protein CBB71_22800 [Rhodopirellula sp. TMED11]
MQLDQTHVAVRVRTLSEIGDLMLVLIYQYPKMLFSSFLIGAFPWIIANTLILGWIPLVEMEFGWDDEQSAGRLFSYLVLMGFLIFLQVPSAGVVTTVALGQAVFEKQPSVRRALSSARKRWKSWFYCLAVRRLAVPMMFIAAMFSLGLGESDFVTLAWFLVVILFLIALVIRGSKPYVPEMILLELCPLRSKDPGQITLSKRSRALHRAAGGDASGRWVGTSVMLMVIAGGLFYSMYWLRGVIVGYWDIGRVVLLVFYPAALWIAGALSVVLRMLCYVDSRIRTEGWDVELAIRAEVLRQFPEDEGFGEATVSGPSASQKNVAATPEPATPEPATPEPATLRGGG